MTFTQLSVRSGPAGGGYRDGGARGRLARRAPARVPYDPHAFEAVAAELAAAGARSHAPYLRGFGATRFASDSTLRSGQQAAIGRDVLSLVDTLKLDAPILVVLLPQ